ncbi:hypothetical protein WG66_000719 [Moniliophthora roreri]|uniref:Microbial-type PARG catalytic domain-containing protein n=1 Tax=Moniliophthora roreri TaxID=221103 RepID=A0A0W0FLS8_MONRR|nr:hypothetical protein WG66_000719 [Moniliophthora roreri]
MPTILRKRRDFIARDTIRRSLAVIAESFRQGASPHSTFVSEQLPPLDQTDCPDPFGSPVPVEIVNLDTLVAARKIMDYDEEAIGKVAVLNLADDIRPAGSWFLHEMLQVRQEECLCYSSTLYITLKDAYYPFPNVGPGSTAGIYSPGVAIFKDQLQNACTDLPSNQRRVVSVISVAAPRWPELSDDGRSFRRHTDVEDLREKIRLVYRMAAHNEKRYLVLGAMGCGFYECPPEQVAREMKDVLLESEFRGWFKKIVFAVLNTANNGPRDFEVFKDTFSGVRV